MDEELLQRVRRALDGWLAGDLGPLSGLLDPDVELVWVRPGEWGLKGKDAVLTLLKQRVGQRTPEGNMELSAAGPTTLVLTREGTAVDGVLPATLIVFAKNMITRIEQYRSRDEAMTAARWRVGG